MMKKKANIIVSSLMACAALSAGTVTLVAGGCSDEESQTASIIAVNFEDASVSVEIGDKYLPDMTSAKDTNGKEYVLNKDFFITVTNAAGEEVPVSDGVFTVEDFGGYTVHYRMYEGTKYVERKVSVSVTDSTLPEISIAGWRSEREMGSFAVPTVYVLDNSGEKLEATCKIVDAQTRQATPNATIVEKTATFTATGDYLFIAEATDSHGNKTTAEKAIKIIPSMGANVWENFDNETRLETVKAATLGTSNTSASWLAEFEGATGVAKIENQIGELWENTRYLSLSFSKTQEEIAACEWDYVTLRMYVQSADETSVTFKSGNVSLGAYDTNKWIDLKLSKKDYLSHLNSKILSNFSGKESMAERYEAFAAAVTGDLPADMLAATTTKRNSSVTFYLDEVTWSTGEEDTTAPKISVTGAEFDVLTNTTMTLPTISVFDDLDPTGTYESIAFYRVTTSGNQAIEIKNNTVQIGEAGTYKLVVTVCDFSGNRANREIIFHAADTIDNSIIARYDGDYQIGGFNGELSWLDEFEGEEGVMKSVQKNANADGAGYLAMKLSTNTIQKMIDGHFDYMKIRVYVEATTTSSELKLYSWWKEVGTLKVGEWNDLYIKVSDLAHHSFLSYQNYLNRSQVYTQFMNAYGYQEGQLFYTNDTQLKNTGEVTYYFDEITWGTTVDSLQFIELDVEEKYSTTDKFLTLPTKIKVTDGVGEAELGLAGVEGYHVDGSNQTLCTLDNGRLPLTRTGTYKLRVKVNASANICGITFSDDQIENGFVYYEQTFTVEPRKIDVEVGLKANYVLNEKISKLDSGEEQKLFYLGTDGTATPTEVAAGTDGKFTLAQLGIYKYTLKESEEVTYETNFAVIDKTNVIYSYADNTERGLNADESTWTITHSVWQRTFTGADGITEYGVQKIATTTLGDFKFDIGTGEVAQDPTKWDYIDVRMYIGSDSANQARITSWNEVIGVNPVDTNKWFTFRVTKEDLLSATYLYYNNWKNATYADLYAKLTYGVSADNDWAFYNIQNILKFTLLNVDGDNSTRNYEIYVSTISYGKFDSNEKPEITEVNATLPEREGGKFSLAINGDSVKVTDDHQKNALGNFKDRITVTLVKKGSNDNLAVWDNSVGGYTATLAEGEYTLTVIATDWQGNESDAYTKTFTVATKNYGDVLKLKANYGLNAKLDKCAAIEEEQKLFFRGADGKADATEVVATEGKFALAQAGIYEYRVYKDDAAAYSEKFQVLDMSNVLYSYADDTERGLNADRGTWTITHGTWVKSFTGADGITEYGLQKVTIGNVGNFTFDLGTGEVAQDPTRWDYIDVRMYIDCAAISNKVRFYSWNAGMGDVNYDTNKWITFRVTKEDFLSPNAIYFGNWKNATYADLYSRLTYGGADANHTWALYNMQQIFDFTVYDLGTNTADVYVSTISYGKFETNEKPVITEVNATIPATESNAFVLKINPDSVKVTDDHQKEALGNFKDRVSVTLVKSGSSTNVLAWSDEEGGYTAVLEAGDYTLSVVVTDWQGKESDAYTKTFTVAGKNYGDDLKLKANYALNTELDKCAAIEEEQKLFFLGADGAAEATEVVAAEGKFALAQAGIYEYRVVSGGEAKYTEKFQVLDMSKVIYSYADNTERGLNADGNSGVTSSTWQKSFTGSNGTEYGVQKVTIANGESFSFDIGTGDVAKDPTKWDYIDVRMYIECTDSNKVRLYSWNAGIGDVHYDTNKWITFRVTKEDFISPNTIYYNNWQNATYADLYSRLTYGGADVNHTWALYNVQNIFKFQVHDSGASGANVYLSTISYGKFESNEKPEITEVNATIPATEGNAFVLKINANDVKVTDDHQKNALSETKDRVSVTLVKSGSSTNVLVWSDTDGGYTAVLEAGDYTLSVVVTDWQGNASDAYTQTFTVAATAEA